MVDFIRRVKSVLFSKPMRSWKKSGYVMPAPDKVKRLVLQRHSLEDCTWIETGTFFGHTTLFLSGIAKHVWTIEPQHDLAILASKRLSSKGNVTVLEGLSEDHLDLILNKVTGNVCFWLDGHYSSGVTFKGPIDTPIREELQIIEKHIRRLGNIVILIDDMRCFEPKSIDYSQYPDRSWLVEWAIRNQLDWMIECDIFVART